MATISIDSVEYPLAKDGWKVVFQSEELEEEWRDFVQMGETTRKSGHGYSHSEGFDATNGVLRQSPLYHAHNNSHLSTGYGYPFEEEGPGATITFDAQSDGSVASSATLTLAHTVGTGDDRILRVGVSNDGNGYPASVIYGGVALTKLVSRAGGTGVTSLWYLLSPPSGTANIVVTFASAHNIVVGAVSRSNVHQGIPFGNAVTAAGTSTGPATVSVVSAAGEVVEDVLMLRNTVQTATVGASQSEHWNAAQGTDVRGAGSSEAGAASVTMSWTLGGSCNWAMIAVPLKPANIQFIYIPDGDKIFKYKYDSNQGLTEIIALSGTVDSAAAATLVDAAPAWADDVYNNNLIKITGGTGIGQRRIITDTTDAGDVLAISPNWDVTPDATSTYEIYASVYVAGGVAGQPVKANGKWYVPMDAVNSRRLDTIGTLLDTWADAGWAADHLSSYQQGATPTFARSIDNAVSLCLDTGNLTSWGATFSTAGDTSTDITGLVEAMGELFPAKEDNLYQSDQEGTAKPVIRSRNRGRSDADNGKGTYAFADIIFYPSADGLDRYRVGGSARGVGVDKIRGFRHTPNITVPLDRRHAFVVFAGESAYVIFNSATSTSILQGRFRGGEDPVGGEMVYNQILEIPLSMSLYVDSRNRLWIKGASVSEDDRDIRVIELDDNGGLSKVNRRGKASSVADIWLDERNWGRPYDIGQLARAVIETENWATGASLQLRFYRDDGTVEDVGSAITASGLTELNWTVGTKDQCRRGRPRLTMTTGATYVPLTSDPAVLSLKVIQRTPTIYQATIEATPEKMKGMKYDPKEGLKVLRKLVSAARVNILEEGINATFSGEIVGVQETLLPEGYSITVYIKRYSVAA